MKKRLKRELRGDFPKPFLFTLALLAFIGLVTLYSATGGDEVFKRQVIWNTLGWSLLIALSLFDIKRIERYAHLIYTLALILLAGVFVRGRVASGAQRWFCLGAMCIQPSEFAKLALILALSRVIALQKRIYNLKDLWKPAILVFPAFFLTVVQPDLGTAIILLSITAAMVFLRGIEKRTLIALLLLFLLILPFSWQHLKDYQKRRILAVINPQAMATSVGYHTIQSKIAIGSGRWWGRGFSQGSQSRLQFIPEKHTDFIFSVYAEERGFVGVLLLVFLYMLFILLIISIASRARDQFSLYLAGGIAVYFAFHLFVNLGMTMGILPVVGVPLPLMSYGGSSIFTTYLCSGIMVGIWRRRLG